MADGVKIEMVGGAELANRLKQLPEKVATNVMVGALYAGARVIRDAARKLVPILDIEKKGGPHEPGNLLANIFASRSRSRDRSTVSAKVGISKAAFYGHFVEFGTKHARAFPFMRPAADGSREAAVSQITAYASGRIEKEAAKTV